MPFYLIHFQDMKKFLESYRRLDLSQLGDSWQTWHFADGNTFVFRVDKEVHMSICGKQIFPQNINPHVHPHIRIVTITNNQRDREKVEVAMKLIQMFIDDELEMYANRSSFQSFFDVRNHTAFIEFDEPLYLHELKKHQAPNEEIQRTALRVADSLLTSRQQYQHVTFAELYVLIDADGEEQSGQNCFVEGQKGVVTLRNTDGLPGDCESFFEEIRQNDQQRMQVYGEVFGSIMHELGHLLMLPHNWIGVMKDAKIDVQRYFSMTPTSNFSDVDLALMRYNPFINPFALKNSDSQHVLSLDRQTHSLLLPPCTTFAIVIKDNCLHRSYKFTCTPPEKKVISTVSPGDLILFVTNEFNVVVRRIEFSPS